MFIVSIVFADNFSVTRNLNSKSVFRSESRETLARVTARVTLASLSHPSCVSQKFKIRGLYLDRGNGSQLSSLQNDDDCHLNGATT